MRRPGNGGAFLGKWFADPGVTVAPVVAGTPWDPDRAADPAPEWPDSAPASLPELFGQGKWWRRQTGEWARVKDMHPAHRANTARMLLRDAGAWAQKVSVASTLKCFSAPDEVFDRVFAEDVARTEDPVAWMRSTKLYRRLVKGLPVVPVHRGGCQVCDERRASGELIPTGPDTGLLADVPDVPKVDAADPWEQDAQRRALRAVLTIFDERLKRGGPYHSRALLQRDVRDLVAEAARQIGITL